jgi:hypothetical protein
MRGFFTFLISLSVSAGPAAAQWSGAPYRDGNRWVLMPINSYIDDRVVGSDVYFPVATRGLPTSRGIMIAGAAICVGKYTGFPSARGFSVSGHATGMTVVPLEGTNRFGAVVRRENADMLVLRNCRFGPIDEAQLRSRSAPRGETEHERHVRAMNDANEAITKCEEAARRGSNSAILSDGSTMSCSGY